MPGPSQISRVLDHFAWLQEQLGADLNAGNAYAGALLTYNAAAALQWYFVTPMGPQDQIADLDDRTKAAKIIDDFVWRIRELFMKAKQETKKALAGTLGKTLIKDLRSAISSLLRRLPRVMQLPKPMPIQARDLLRSLNPTELLKSWLSTRKSALLKAKVANAKTALEAGPRAGLRSMLAAASVVADESVYGPRGKDYRKGSSEVIAAMLRYTLDDYVKTLDKKSAKRTKAFVEDLIQDIEAVQAR